MSALVSRGSVCDPKSDLVEAAPVLRSVGHNSNIHKELVDYIRTGSVRGDVAYREGITTMIFQQLSFLALRGLVAVVKMSGVPGGGGGEEIADRFVKHFTDHSQKLLLALQKANERAWKAIEISLAGDSFRERCKAALASAEDKAFSQQVRLYLDATPLAGLPAHGAEFRQKCLRELREARGKKLLTEVVGPQKLKRWAENLAQYTDPQKILVNQAKIVARMAEVMQRENYAHLAKLLSTQPKQGESLLVIATRYFLRREIEEDPKLFQSMVFGQMEKLQQGQEQAFAALHDILKQGQRVQELLDSVLSVATEGRDAAIKAHETVLDIKAEQERRGKQNDDMYKIMIELQRRSDLSQGEVRPRDSLSASNENDQKMAKELLEKYSALPEDQWRELPALLNGVGKLKIATGDSAGAAKAFEGVAAIVTDPQAKAEAHFNAYRAALEQRNWKKALDELLEAIKLDGKKYAPFPVAKYHPKRILGAGGFGVVFLCQHKRLDLEVVVKALLGEDLDRSMDEVFKEGKALLDLHHPAIIRLMDCDYAIPARKSRPYLVLNYFKGVSLEEYVKKQPMAVEDMLLVAVQMAEGLQKAHALGIRHRDVKPANVLVRKVDSHWQVKLIDFGLAMRSTNVQTHGPASQTLKGQSIAGTIDYAAPEQRGKLPGVAVELSADVYAFAKTCCYAMFQTPQPLPKHWNSLPPALQQLLAKCLEEQPSQRLQNFKEVLDGLAQVNVAHTSVSEIWKWGKGKVGQLLASRTTLEKVAQPSIPAEKIAPARPVAEDLPKYYQSGRMALKEGEYDKAIEDLTCVIALDPRHSEAFHLRGVAYDRKGDLDRAIADFTQAIALVPRQTLSYQERGRAYVRKKEADSAIRDCTKAIELSPAEATSYYVRGKLHLEKGAYDLAVADFTSVIQLTLQNPAALQRRGVAYMGKKEIDLAIHDFTQAIQLNPNDAGICRLRGEAYSAKGKYDQAIIDFSRAVHLESENALLYLSRGEAYARMGYNDQALADYKQAIQLDPLDPKGYFSRGSTNLGLDAFDEAIDDFTETLQLDPKYAAAYLPRADAYLGKNAYDEAIADITQSLNFAPQNAAAYYLRGGAYFEQKDYNKAIADFAQSVQFDSKNAMAYHDRAVAFHDKREYGQAIADCSRAIQLQPQDSENYWLRGLLYYVTGAHDKSIADCTEAINRDSQNALAYQCRGLAYNARGNPEKAETDLKTAVGLDPTLVSDETPSPSLTKRAVRRLANLDARKRGGKVSVTFTRSSFV